MTIHDRRVVPFRSWHFRWLPAVGRAESLASVEMSDAMLAQMERLNSWTGVVDGVPLVCAGTIPQWPGRSTAWAYVARGTGPHMTWITEQVCAALDKVKGRIELTVRSDFRPGQRWAKRLGFSVETPVLKAFGPLGEDHVGFVRFNGG